LKRQRDKEEAIVSVQFAMKAFPLDGSNALYDVCQQEFGFADVVGEENPSGGTPPKTLGIKLADGSIKNVPWGRIQFPGFEKEEYIETNFNPNTMEFVITGEIKRKNEDMVNKVARLTEQYLKSNSIYKGQSFKIDLGFMSKPGTIPEDPKFMRVNDVNRDDVILSDAVRNEYSQVLFRIENVGICKDNNIPLKHGCVLAGPYGTGKTLLAKMTANLANQNG
jgi:SpoVK/Ycf46/Vps4 family AAA+-type ATPase